MNVFDAVKNRLEVRDYASREVDERPEEPSLTRVAWPPAAAEPAARAVRGLEDPGDIARLAELSSPGCWVRGADSAVVVCTGPQYSDHEIDPGRALTHTQRVAWKHGVGSCIYTGFDEEGTRAFLRIPDRYAIPVVVGFGYPAVEPGGAKVRTPLGEVAFTGRFGDPQA